MLLEVYLLDDDRWVVLVDGGQTGIYPTLALAKAAARRRIPVHSRRLAWERTSGFRWRARV